MENTGSQLLETIFPGGSEMSRLMRATDWTQTPLGDPASWPEGLKIPLRMLLTSRFEMWLGWGPDLLFFYNDAYIPTLGIKHPSMLGRPFREVWSEVYADVEDQVSAVAQGQSTWNDAMLLLLERSGYPEETYHSFSYSPLHDGSGAVAGLLCIVTEETERVISERHIATLRSLGTELAGCADQHAVEQAVCRVLGAERRDFPFSMMRLGSNPNYVACQEDLAGLETLDWPAARDGTGVIALSPDFDYPAGPWRSAPTQALVVPVNAAQGEALQGSLILGLNPFRGATDLHEVAQLIAGQIGGALASALTLQTERRRADRIWSHSRDLIVVVDAAGVFRSVNPAWTRILGHAPQDVVGHHFEDFMAPDDVAASRAALMRAIDEADLIGFENRFRAVDGSLHWISWHTAQEDGLVYAYGRDVTEQKAAAEALGEAEQALRQAQKMEAVGQLTGGIAHDFNNLLTGIIGSLEAMERRAARGVHEDTARYVGLAKTCAHRAAGLTQRLLAFSRRQSLDARRVEAGALIADMEDLLRRTIGEDIVLSCQAEKALWPIRCDANQLESAILNLAINSRDAMSQGGALTVKAANEVVGADTMSGTTGTIKAGDYVALRVADTGAGMSAETMAKVFEPFFTTKPIGQGTGLGLSMIYGFVRQSGGHVLIDSALGAGTSVTLLFPRDMQGEDLDVEEDQALFGAGATSDNHVLIVEDEPIVRELVVETLADLGYRTIEAADGPSGLDILKSDARIDLLVTDVGLPGINGRQLADAGRVERPELKILFMTGYAHNASGAKGLLEPGMELITKPFTIETLSTQVRSILEA